MMDIQVYTTIGKLHKFTIQLILISDSLFQTTTKKDLMFTYFTYPGWQSTLDIYTYTIPLPHDVMQDTFIIGLKSLAASSRDYHYEVHADPIDKKIKGNTYRSNTGVIYHGVAYYGYTCPEKYAFS